MVVYEKDTVVLFSPYQVKKISSIVLDRDFLRQEGDLLRQLSFAKDSIIFCRDRQIQDYKGIINSYESSTQNLESIIDERDKELKEASKKALKTTIWVGTGCAVIGIIIGFLVK